MKKSVSILLASIFSVAMLSGCSPKNEATSNTDTQAKTDTTTTDTTSSNGTGIVKLGLGHITSIASSKDLEKGKGALGQVDTALAVVGFDKDGKVVKAIIDSAQTKVEFNDDLTLKTDTTAPGKTKDELKDEYGMKKASKIGKEWYQQAEALANWMEGKTVDEIKAMKTKKKDEKHTSVPDVAELTSSVSISVEDYLAAVEEASKNTVDVANGEKVGLGHVISTASSKALGKADGKEVLPLAQVDDALVATAYDKDGKVVGAIVDNAQTKVKLDKDGKVTSDKAAEYKTKDELKEEYGMLKASKIGKEWYQQAEALAKWMKGKTTDEIKSMKTKKSEEGSLVADIAELTSSVTMSVGDYLEAAEEAYSNAK